MDNTPPPPPPKFTMAERLGDGTRNTSESLGVAFSVIFTWYVNDVQAWDIPIAVQGAMLTCLGIVLGRLQKRF